MAPRSKADSEEATIVTIEIVAANLRKEVEALETFVKLWREQHKALPRGDGEDGGRSDTTGAD